MNHMIYRLPDNVELGTDLVDLLTISQRPVLVKHLIFGVFQAGESGGQLLVEKIDQFLGRLWFRLRVALCKIELVLIDHKFEPAEHIGHEDRQASHAHRLLMRLPVKRFGRNSLEHGSS